MQCKDVELVVEQDGLAPLPEAARAHLAACGQCREFVADLATIVSVANELPAEVAPPARLWLSLQAQLELEGIIKTPVVPAGGQRSSWWQGFHDLFRRRALATATVGGRFVAAGVFDWWKRPMALREAPASFAVPLWQIPSAQTAKVWKKRESILETCSLPALLRWTPLSGRICSKWMILLPTASAVCMLPRRTTWRANICPTPISKRPNYCPR